MILYLQIDIVFSGLVNATFINELCVGMDILRYCRYRDNALHVFKIEAEWNWPALKCRVAGICHDVINFLTLLPSANEVAGGQCFSRFCPFTGGGGDCPIIQGLSPPLTCTGPWSHPKPTIPCTGPQLTPDIFRLVQLGPTPPDMFILVHYEACTVS